MNLPGALARLDDGEIDALLAAVTDEAKRRGRLPSTTPPEPERRQLTGSRPRAETSGHRLVGDESPSLTLGKANAVRAAFAAGVKPSIIARQFGISQSAVKQALAAEGRGRKS